MNSRAVAVARFGVASVWAYQGVWKKVLGRDPRHRQIVALVPGLRSRGAGVAVTGLGLGEGALATWVLSGWRPKRAAGVQTVVLVGMNVGGLLVARSQIASPGRMLARNAAFLGLIWSLA